jgi:hypothetical protein
LFGGGSDLVFGLAQAPWIAPALIRRLVVFQGLRVEAKCWVLGGLARRSGHEARAASAGDAQDFLVWVRPQGHPIDPRKRPGPGA